MTRLVFVCILALLTASLAGQSRYPEHFQWGSGDGLAFIGDEATYDGRWCQYVENYFFTRYADKRLVFYNSGSLNDTAADVMARLETDVIDRKIDIALIMVGTFDAGFSDIDPDAFAAYQEQMRAILDELKRSRIHPILLSPPMFDQRVHSLRRAEDEAYRFRLKPISPYNNGVMAYYTSWLREEAVARGHRFIDAWSALNANTHRERKVNPDFSLMADAVLPDAGGHAVIAAEVIGTLAPERQELGQIRLYYQGKTKKWESRVEGGRLSQLSGSSNAVSFIWKAPGLPWAFPMDAVIGAQVAKVDERFNQETLHIIGLEPGDYELLIAGEKVGNFSYNERELALGLALHHIPGRPQYRRAEAVAKRNAQRYAAFIRPLRDHWQQIKRTRVNFPEDPEKLEAVIRRLEPEMNQLRNQAREEAQAIYETAKPLGRQFEIRQVNEEE